MNTIKHTPLGKHTLARQVVLVFSVTAMLLMIPVLGMLLSDEMNWGPGDFAFAAVLLSGTGLAYVFGSRLARTGRQRVILGALLGLALLTIWAEAAVGIFH